MTATKFGTFAELLEITAVEMQPVLKHLREIMLEIDHTAVEVVRLGDRAATYGLGPHKMIEGYAYILPHQHWVNLGFFHGVELPDPAGLMGGTGKSMRHVKIHSLPEAERPEVRRLLQEARAERRRALNL
jgi:hypothetical protein